MPLFPRAEFEARLAAVEEARSVQEKGQAFEELMCSLFVWIPGIEIAERNALNAFQAEEIDVALYNGKEPDGLPFLPFIFLVECKNWSRRVGRDELSTFIRKCQGRGCDHGVLIAANGITGNAAGRTAAHFEVARALTEGFRLIVLTLDEIRPLESSEQFVLLLKRKLCQLVAAGTLVEQEMPN